MRRTGRYQGKGLTLLLVMLLFTSLMSGCFGSTQAKVNKQLELAVKYVSENKFKEAILAYQEVIKIDKREVKAYQGLGKVYTLRGKFDKAQEIYNQGIEAVKDENILQLKLSLAGMYIDKGYLAEAEKLYKAIIDEDKTCIEAYQGLALVYEENGDSGKALAILKAAVEANNRDCRAYNALAGYYAATGDKDQALRIIGQSLALDVNQGEAYSVLKDLYGGSWLELQGQASGIPNRNVVAMLKFYALYEIGNHQEALQVYEGQLAGQPDNQKAKVLAAIGLLKTGSKDRADAMIQEVAEEKPNAWIMADLAWYYLMAGNKDKALLWAQRGFIGNTANLDAVAVLSKAADTGTLLQGALSRTKFLLYNTKPLLVVEQEMNARSLDIPVRHGSEHQLTFGHFVPQGDCEYAFESTLTQNGIPSSWDEYRITWKRMGFNQYSSVAEYDDGKRIVTNRYRIGSDGVCWLSTEDFIPQSEPSNSRVIKGNSYELKWLEPGDKWTNRFQVLSEFESQSIEDVTETYRYVGQEKIEVLGRKRLAAHIICDKATKIVKDETGRGDTLPNRDSIHFWYVQGLGLVKSVKESAAYYGEPYKVETELVSYGRPGERKAALEALKANVNVPEYGSWEDVLNTYDMAKADLTGDGEEEIIFSSYTYGNPCVVLKWREGRLETVYNSNRDSKYDGWRNEASIDDYNNLLIDFSGGGTGVLNKITVVMRWDRRRLREIWSGTTNEYSYPAMEGEKWYEKKGNIKIYGNPPERLVYTVTNQSGICMSYDDYKELRKEVTTTEYSFDPEKFKFVPVK